MENLRETTSPPSQLSLIKDIKKLMSIFMSILALHYGQKPISFSI